MVVFPPPPDTHRWLLIHKADVTNGLMLLRSVSMVRRDTLSLMSNSCYHLSGLLLRWKTFKCATDTISSVPLLTSQQQRQSARSGQSLKYYCTKDDEDHSQNAHHTMLNMQLRTKTPLLYDCWGGKSFESYILLGLPQTTTFLLTEPEKTDNITSLLCKLSIKLQWRAQPNKDLCRKALQFKLFFWG